MAQFLPHIRDYLDDGGIAYHIVIAEQAEGLPFNRGAMKNIGFQLGAPSDYCCFHDVDYLPLNADYSWSDDPACLVLVGVDKQPVKAKDPSQPIQLDMTKFFGGAVLMPDALFRQVDGYSNQYWGWGMKTPTWLLVSRSRVFPGLGGQARFVPSPMIRTATKPMAA